MIRSTEISFIHSFLMFSGILSFNKKKGNNVRCVMLEGNFFLIAPFPDHCLLLPFSGSTLKINKVTSVITEFSICTSRTSHSRYK